jgi:putative spermidine/putrescine transport system permease protein
VLAALPAACLVWLVPLAEQRFDRAVTLPLYRRLLGETLWLACLCALLCLAAGYPLAWLLRLAAERSRRSVLLGVVAPGAVAGFTRALGWVVVIGEFGLINLMLRALRLEADMPRDRGTREWLVLAGMAQVFLPFTVLALFRGFQAVPTDTMRAARTLGASPARVFREVVLPQTVRSAVVAVTVVFALAAGAYVTVVLTGGTRVRILAGLAFQESGTLLHWQIGAVLAIAAASALLALVRSLIRAES